MSSWMPSRAESVPREYIPAVNKGVIDTLPNGVLAGFPVVDVR